MKKKVKNTATTDKTKNKVVNNSAAIPLSLNQLFFKSTALALGIAGVMLLFTALIFGVWGYSKFNTFLKNTGIPKKEFTAQLKAGWNQEPIATKNHKNFLILGLDTLIGRGDIPALTDTMMLVSVDLENATVSTIPLPRDLWNEDYQTKINALYHYGKDRYPENPEQFTTEVIEEMTGLEIHHTIVVSLNQLERLIDQFDGIEIDVKQGFIDSEFPRTGIDVTRVRDPKILYETIVFEAGPQTMDGETALKYIRSRKSENDQGHDLARSNRQQEVVSALLKKLTDLGVYVSDPKMAGQLFSFYNENFSDQLSFEEIISTAKTLYPKRSDINFSSENFSTTLEDPINGVIDNPRPSYKYQNQWVYVITNPVIFKEEVKEKLIN